jgi:hypothetical protein
MAPPRHLSSLVALVSACGTLVITIASGPAVPTVTTGVVTFSDLITQDLERPPRVVERPARSGSAKAEPWESPLVGNGRDAGILAGGAPVMSQSANSPTGPSPMPTLTFGAVQGSSTVPPDSTGAVGPTQVLTVTNHGLQAHTKAGAFIGAVSTWTFWGMFNPSFPFDPRVIYDPVQQRFIIVALDYRSNGQGTYDGSIYIAVSHTSNLLGGWTLRKYLSCVTAVPCSSSNAGALDFPMVGLSRNFLAIGVVGNLTYVFSYPALRQTQGQAPVTVFHAAGPGYLDRWGAPAVSSSATEGDLFFVKLDGATRNFRLNRLTGPPDAPSFAPGPLITVPSHLRQDGCVPYRGVNQAPEPGTGNNVTIPATPVNSDAVFRDDYVWFTESKWVQAPDCGGHARVLWLQLHKSGTFADGGVIEDPTGKWFMYPTIAVNRFHDVLVGFTQTSASEYASAAYAFRAGTDPAGTMRDARVYKPGEGHFNLPYSAGVSRWGDYSHTVVDPGDDTTLWTIQEYARAQVGTGPGSGRWGTWWASVNPRAPQPPGAPRALQATATGSSVLLNWAAPIDGGAPASYSIEAGSGPGSANLANFPTRNTALSYGANGIPDGTYYVRVRASNSIGVGPPSNEATLVVGCASAPGAPAALTIVTNSGGTVTLSWQASTGGPTSYIIEAGTAPGLANIVAIDLGNAGLTMTANGVRAGTYYVRTRGRNRCGTGPASNEVVVIVQ